MKKHSYIYIACLLSLLVVTILTAASCSSSGNESPVIADLEVDHLYVYPRGKSIIQCIVYDPDGDNMTFIWTCSDGTFIGSGPIVTWQAPNKLGNFHIMVTVNDEHNNNSTATVTIGVLPNEQPLRPSHD